MKKISIIGLIIFLLLIFTACEDEDGETALLDECIIDEDCELEHIIAEDYPNETMVSMIESYSIENNLWMPISGLTMTVRRDTRLLELEMNHYEVIYDLSEYDFGLVKDMLVELYDYTNSILNPVERIFIEAGLIHESYYEISYSPEFSEIKIYNSIDEDYTGDISDFYNQLTNVFIENDFDDFSIFFIYSCDVEFYISNNYYNAPSKGNFLYFPICNDELYCSETNKQSILSGIKNLLPDENFEISNFN